jgi:hypothetical protein
MILHDGKARGGSGATLHVCRPTIIASNPVELGRHAAICREGSVGDTIGKQERGASVFTGVKQKTSDLHSSSGRSKTCKCANHYFFIYRRHSRWPLPAR